MEVLLNKNQTQRRNVILADYGRNKRRGKSDGFNWEEYDKLTSKISSSGENTSQEDSFTEEESPRRRARQTAAHKQPASDNKKSKKEKNKKKKKKNQTDRTINKSINIRQNCPDKRIIT